MMLYFQCGKQGNDVQLILTHEQNSLKYDSTNPPVIIKDFSINKYNISDIIKTITLIPLETNNDCLVGNIHKILATSEYFILFDKSYEKAIYLFHRNGKFHTKISRRGKGPGEYILPTDISINHYDKSLELLDLAQRKIIKYTFDGIFCSEIYLEDLALPVSFINYDSGYLVSTQNFHIPNLGWTFFNLYEFSSKGDLKSNNFPNREHDKLFAVLNNDVLSPYGSSINYVASWENMIYNIDNNIIRPSFKFDFGNRGIPISLIEEYRKIQFSNQEELSKISFRMRDEINNSNYMYGPNLICETDEYIYISCQRGRDFFPVFYSKKTKKVFSSPAYNIDMWLCYALPYFLPVATTEKGEFIGGMIPSKIIQQFKDIKKEATKEQLEAIKEGYKDYISLIENIDEYDNPIISIIEFEF